MKNNMEEIDRLIKETLTQEESKFYDELEEQNVFEMMGDLFKTKNSWLIIIMNIIMLISLGFFVYCIVQFFNAEETKEIITWTAAGFISLMMVSMLKLFAWMQMDKNALLRELKRLELQVSSLSTKISD